jgi:hypothetical protein
VHLPLQARLFGALQLVTQAPALQATVPPVGAAHLFAQAPQLEASVVMSMQVGTPATLQTVPVQVGGAAPFGLQAKAKMASEAATVGRSRRIILESPQLARLLNL